MVCRQLGNYTASPSDKCPISSIIGSVNPRSDNPSKLCRGGSDPPRPPIALVRTDSLPRDRTLDVRVGI
jgi:hypothetical protein